MPEDKRVIINLVGGQAVITMLSGIGIRELMSDMQQGYWPAITVRDAGTTVYVNPALVTNVTHN